ncbi:beta-N-acetylhexosaminidase [Andreprevotia lacus DSM 23236]|uniref:Beta-N-acetylhexosaminidase n=1 Tax=Andreprevotia lacus DSM 23236 TaxID=1121001 RepID=A0A1W1XZD6_9NEIS|nr:beta-N-acetylhexosaminidase [Andreprevotia lacus]SMC29227.1 beta-N-acetylhexosaminidase [Andreprevotia lacus DSM 23236]
MKPFDVAALTPARQIGQLLMAGFDGLEPDAHITQLIRERHLGGVILFRRNVESPAQVARLCRQLQAINAEVSDIPLLIGIDQEGGMVMRIEDGMTPLPSPLAFQAAGSVDDCRELTRLCNAELAALGININFAPSFDINNNRNNPVIGVRAYGEDVATVDAYAGAALAGIKAAGLATTAKHFPGHGDTDTDSHLGMPRVPHDRARLDAVELAPFRAAIAAGVDAIMTAHVAFPAIEPDADTPATMSHAVLTGLLRDELGFSGVVFTDCLEMDAIAKGRGTVTGALAAFRAGADVLLISHTPQRQHGFLDTMQARLVAGDIAPARLQAAVARILALKQRLPDRRELPDVPGSQLALPDALALSRRVHRNAVQCVGERVALDPVLPVVVLTCEVRTRTEIDEVANGRQAQRRESLAPHLAQAGLTVAEIPLPLAPSDAEIDAAVGQLPADAQIVLVSYNAVLHPAQRALLARLPTERLWLIAGRLPYDLDLQPQARGRLAAFSNRPAALAALTEFLLAPGA